MTLYYPQVTWSGGSHTLTFGTPVDAAQGMTHIEVEMARVPGTGEQDSWVDGEFQRAMVTFRYVPASGSATNAGWHFPAPGVRAWVIHQQHNKDTFTYKPDKDSGGSHTCRLIGEPRVSREDAQPVLYRIEMEIEDTGGNPFTEY